jgi:hypothetical protein
VAHVEIELATSKKGKKCGAVRKQNLPPSILEAKQYGARRNRTCHLQFSKQTEWANHWDKHLLVSIGVFDFFSTFSGVWTARKKKTFKKMSIGVFDFFSTFSKVWTVRINQETPRTPASQSAARTPPFKLLSLKIKTML